jgi:hypothetical protein
MVRRGSTRARARYDVEERRDAAVFAASGALRVTPEAIGIGIVVGAYPANSFQPFDSAYRFDHAKPAQSSFPSDGAAL